MSRKRRKTETEILVEQAKDLFKQYDLSNLIEKSRAMSRKFILHIGPTNSGKTFQALQALKEAGDGVYLGPLRLMALEVFDKLNADGCPCTLLTGEEFEPMDGARFAASTIELCNYQAKYSVAVIDEAQLIGDKFRGANWTKAILAVNADVVHICMAPEAEKVITELMAEIRAPFEIVRHERLTPLVYSGILPNLRSVRKGDCLITFSRRGVLSLAATMEKMGMKASVIYGALPPAARREEVRRFESGETSVVVATDAIGLGISLPIKRIVFCSTSKFDGESHRDLLPEEIKQIAGRAGRFGIHKKGEVLTMHDEKLIRSGLDKATSPIESLSIPFPKETLNSEFKLLVLLKAWNELYWEKGEMRQEMQDAELLLREILFLEETVSKHLLYQMVTCPVDRNQYSLVAYWATCCRRIADDKELPLPSFGDHSLEVCELQYKAYDIRHQLLRRIGVEEPHLKEKEILVQKINGFLTANKDRFLRTCSCCGEELPFDYPYGMCQDCYESQWRPRYYGGYGYDFNDEDWDDDDEDDWDDEEDDNDWDEDNDEDDWDEEDDD